MKWIELFTFTIVGDKYKITYNGTEPIKVFISTRLVGVNSIHKTIRIEFKGNGHWFIPSLDYRGCSYITFNSQEDGKYLFEKLIDRSLSNSVKGQNVYCIGLNKSGTTSLTQAFEKLGYRSFPENQLFHYVQNDVYFGDYGKLFSVIENPQFNFFNDIPFSFPKVYEKIYERRPNDIFVLTLRRDAKAWAKTCMRFWDCLVSENFKNDRSFIHTYYADNSEKYLINHATPMFEFWGLENVDNLEEKLINIYEQHTKDCLEFFKDKKNFIMVDIEKKGEYKRLTDWLGVENEELDFPWENKNQKNPQ
jgi:hypothetical protein